MINEFVIASVLLQTTDKFTLGLGMQSYIDQQYSEHWGPFAAGVLLTSLPVVLLFIFLQRFIVGGLTQRSGQGMSATATNQRVSLLDQPITTDPRCTCSRLRPSSGGTWSLACTCLTSRLGRAPLRRRR